MPITNPNHPKTLNRCKILQHDIWILICFLLTRNKSLSSFNRMRYNRILFNNISNAFGTWLGLFLPSYRESEFIISASFIFNFIAYCIQISFTFLFNCWYSFYLFLSFFFGYLLIITIIISSFKQILILLFGILNPFAFLNLLTLIMQIKYFYIVLLL